MSKKQVAVILSTTKIEYITSNHASNEDVWLQRLCSKIGFKHQATRKDCDSQSGIFLAKNPAYHSKMKHIDVQYHFVRDMVEIKKVLLENIETMENVGDALTKFVSIDKFSWCKWEFMPQIVDLEKFVLHVCKEKNKWDNAGYVLYSLHEDLPRS